uniref:CDP-diacylglycerol--inositol 3-phosphatidyltransferase n=1 Tax=Hucho hucho TaxID=62062 RepID=A0A4W5R3W4_9TELE
MERNVLVYWPNIIGYIRLVLILCAWTAFNNPPVFLSTYSISVILDGLDGWLARRLGQTSRFGAWLDVVTDNLGRSMVWSQLYEWGWMVSSVEWCVFVCNHNARGAQWKSSFTDSPLWVQAIMAKGFRTPLGTWMISGLHGLPLWLYGYQRGVLSHPLCAPLWLQTLGTLILAAGRLLGVSVEIWCVWAHIKHLTKDEVEEQRE